MGIRRERIIELSPSHIGSLPGECAGCCFWETAGRVSPGACERGIEKARFLSRCLENRFTPGKILQVEGQTVGYIQFAPPGMVPRLSTMLYPAPSPRSIYVTCVFVLPEYRGRGLGKRLLRSTMLAMLKRGQWTLETHGLPGDRFGPPGPADFFSCCGFRVVKDHPEAPLMRLDLRSLVPGREIARAYLTPRARRAAAGIPVGAD